MLKKVSLRSVERSFRGLVLVATLMASGLFLSPAVTGEAASISAGAFELIPLLSLEQRFDDNIFSQAETEQSSQVTVLTPSLAARMETSTVGLELAYRHQAGLYASSSDDNFNDNSFGSKVIWRPNHRHRVNLNALLNKTHEDRGTGYSQGLLANAIDEPDRLDQSELAATYRYGSNTARGRLLFDLGAREKTFTNHRSLTRTRDYDEVYYSTTFLWRIGGRTDALFEVNSTDTNYNLDPEQISGGFDTRDSDSLYYRAGVTWDVSGKSEGTIRIGHAEKNFDDADRENFSGSSWAVEMKWSPKSYSTFALETSRKAEETDGVGSYIDQEIYALNWRHKWSERLSSLLDYGLLQKTYEGDSSGRTEDTQSYGIKVNYDMRRWLYLGVTARYSDKDSSVSQFDYQRNIFAFYARITL